MPDLEQLFPESSQPNVNAQMTSSSASTTTGHSSVYSDCSVLSHDDGRHLEIAAIESTFMVHEFDERKQKWVKRTRTAFNIIIEDMHHNRSLVRYVPDFEEFDKRIKTHYRRSRVPLPPLTEPPLDLYTRKRRNSVTSLLSRLAKLAARRSKSNSEKIEMYLRRCALHPTVGRSSLFRDFLSAQRNEDKVIPNRAILEQIQLEQSRLLYHRASSIIAAPAAAMAIAMSQPVAMQSSASSMVMSYHGNDEVANRSSTGVGNLIHVPRTASQEDIVIGGITSDASAYESLIDDTDMPSKVTPQDFEILKVLGKQRVKVFLVRRRHPPSKLLALKAIRKERVMTDNQIVHTLRERDILTKISKIRHPFLIKLHYAFQDVHQLFLVFDFHVGGDLATQLRMFQSFPAKRCRLYAAEILLGLEELHRLGILYRDLKPENILLRADGHLVLTDFSLSKLLDEDDMERTGTFCGTPEYIAPEILLQQEYSYAVDFWSYGTILYEMIDSEPPFYHHETITMYRRVMIAPLMFSEAFDNDPDAVDLISGLLERDPSQRLGTGPDGTRAIRSHPYFKSINWSDVYHRRIIPPYVPELQSKDDCANFDEECLAESPRLGPSIVEGSPTRMQPTSTSGMTFPGYSYINDSQMTEDTPSFTNDSRWMLSEDDDMYSHNHQRHPSSMSYTNGSSKSLNDSNVTDPNPSFIAEQQGNSSVFYYNESEVVPYDIYTTESDEYMPTAGAAPYYYGTGSAILSMNGPFGDDADYESDTERSNNLPKQAPVIPLSRHYGARQINANF
ncbi:kinase-like domain-containing protein [Fennellomyces sp. T-0311]|nr:kinase-like domain-containing protein [Fennellomyces sp. T-0311]